MRLFILTLLTKFVDKIFQFDEEETTKPMGRLTKLILSQPFAKNWFFKAPEKSSELRKEFVENFQRHRQSREMAYFSPQNF